MTPKGIRRQTGELTLKVNSMHDLIEKVDKEESVEFEQEAPKEAKRNVRTSARRSNRWRHSWCFSRCGWACMHKKE